MSGKKENCEINSHLHEEEKEEDKFVVEAEPAASNAITPNGVGEAKSLTELDSDIDALLRKDSESEFCDTVHYLDSILEYASKIRAFVGLDDDSEPPPLPKSNPMDIVGPRKVSENANLDSSDGEGELSSTENGNSNTTENAERSATESDECNSTKNADRDLNQLAVSESDKSATPGDMDSGLSDAQISTPSSVKGESNSENIQLTDVFGDVQARNDLKNDVVSKNINDDTKKDYIAEEGIPENYSSNTPEEQISETENKNIEERRLEQTSGEEPDDTTFEQLETVDCENPISKIQVSESSTNLSDDAGNERESTHLSNFSDAEKDAELDNQCEDPELNDNLTDRRTPEMFAFDPEYVSELQQEDVWKENEVYHSNIEVLRRLSTEIVRKVLDDAGNQIQEILEERRKSSLEHIDLVTNEKSLSSVNDNVPTDVPKCSDREEEENNAENCEKGPANNASEDTSDQEKIPELSLKNEVQLKDVLAKTYDSDDFKRRIEMEMNRFDPQYDVDPDTVCGIGSFKPKWLQQWATARVYLVLYSIIGTLSGSYYTYLIGTITTLEKRFAFDSKITGTIMMVDEITPLFLGSLVGYFGGKAHRPRMVGFGMLLSAICCFISAAPYFIYGAAKHMNVQNIDNPNNLEMCDGKIQDQNCWSDDRPPTLTAILLLIFGSFLKGFGNLAYYAVGFAYMDDNLKKKNAPMYFAIAMSLRLVGPVIGFLMSSAFLKYPENPFDYPEYGPEDPRWIGGWWMGFVVQGFLLLLFTIPISLFPRKLPGKRSTFSSRENPKGKEDIIHNIAGLFSALKRLAKNPIYVLFIINCNVSAFGVFGHYVMLPKYMENQFRLSASDASLFSGPPALVSIIISIILGGYIVWKLRPNAKVITGGIAILQGIASIGYLLLMIPRCERVQMMNYGFSDKGFNLEDMCNGNCNCSTTAFTPICGPDGRTAYFSPCHAGCSGISEKTYFNCSCIEDSIRQEGAPATHGLCVDESCWFQALAYIIFLPCLEFIINSLRVGFSMVLLRSILPEDKSVALGTFETFACAFTFLPFPIVFGALIDSCCLVWEESCQKTGNCWFYDTDKFNYYLHGVPAIGCFIATATMIIICCLGDRIRDLYKEDYEEDSCSKENNLLTSSEKDKTTNIELG